MRGPLVKPITYAAKAIMLGNRFDDTHAAPFNGVIDDVVIWQKALTEADLLRLYGLQWPVTADEFF
jgi:hypothetical protein